MIEPPLQSIWPDWKQLKWLNNLYNWVGLLDSSLVERSSPADTTISTTESSEDEISITIPSNWNTYDAEITVSCGINETGTATTNTGYIFRVRAGSGTGGASITNIQGLLGTVSPDTRIPSSFFGYQEGLTATGSVTWSLTSFVTSDDAQYSMIDINWQVKVYRVS